MSQNCCMSQQSAPHTSLDCLFYQTIETFEVEASRHLQAINHCSVRFYACKGGLGRNMILDIDSPTIESLSRSKGIIHLEETGISSAPATRFGGGSFS